MHMIKLRRRQNELRSVIVFTQACVKVFFFLFFFLGGEELYINLGQNFPLPKAPNRKITKSQHSKIQKFKNQKAQTRKTHTNPNP